MKVGILTYHWSYNFGANLQVLALQSVLRKKGVDCEVINYRDPHKVRWYLDHTQPEQAAAHEEFLNKYLHLGPVLTEAAEVEEYCKDSLDAVLVGSDAVFRLSGKYSPRSIVRTLLGRNQSLINPVENTCPSPYWLNWSRNTHDRRIAKASIAASAEGSPYYHANPRLFPALHRSIRDFDFVSVRDAWTAKMVRTLSLGTRAADICPDPVFALNSAFVIPSTERPPVDVSNTVLLSGDFGVAWTERFVRAAHARGMKVSNLPNPDRPFAFREADFEIKLPLSPLQWFGLLANAAGFIGIRFHALVSCITNRTPAVGLDSLGAFQFNYKSRSKVFDLCQRAGIPKRYTTINRIPSTDPEKLLANLENRSSQKRADDYAAWAEKRFSTVIDQALEVSAALLSRFGFSSITH